MSHGFTLSEIVVVESLEPHEAPTGAILVKTLDGLIGELAPNLRVTHWPCESALEFRAQMQQLADRARKSGVRPLLHIEAHGSEAGGLEFANGSSLSWDDLGLLLTELNVATQFNLFVVVAACYGAHLVSQFSPLSPAPAWGIVAPTRSVDPGELLRGFRSFYGCLLRTKDATLATTILEDGNLSEGHWFSEMAEDWFGLLVTNYIKENLSHRAVRNWARSLSRRMRGQGYRAGVGSVTRQLRTQHATTLSGKYFDAFFCVGRVPGAEARFEAVRERLQRSIASLRATGLYML
jgi:hypothetical protein